MMTKTAERAYLAPDKKAAALAAWRSIGADRAAYVYDEHKKKACGDLDAVLDGLTTMEATLRQLLAAQGLPSPSPKPSPWASSEHGDKDKESGGRSRSRERRERE